MMGASDCMQAQAREEGATWRQATQGLYDDLRSERCFCRFHCWRRCLPHGGDYSTGTGAPLALAGTDKAISCLSRHSALLEQSRHWIKAEDLNARIEQALDNPVPLMK